MMKLWLFILLAVPLSTDAIDCSAISKEDINDIKLVVKECNGTDTLGVEGYWRISSGFSQSDFDALFGKVKTLRMDLIIKESDIVNMTMPELKFINGGSMIIEISSNHKLHTISFPRLEKYPEDIRLRIAGNRLLSNESAQMLKNMSHDKEDSWISGFGDCFIIDDVVYAASEFDGCKTVSSGLKLDHTFNGTTNAVISRVGDCIEIVDTTIEDISFLKLTERGHDWDECHTEITIENNPNLCTSDFVNMIEKLNPKPTYSIKNNKDEAVCEKERKDKEAAKLLEASKTTETVTTMTTTTEVNSSAYQYIFAALCLVAVATIFAVL